MSNTTIIPTEIQELSLKVPQNKQGEVGLILSQVFQKTNDWENQIAKINVNSVDDTEQMSQAKKIRLEVKKARLEAEKKIDLKRKEVQLRMADDKLEDSLWLKAKQIMQMKAKAIEEKAEWQEKFAERCKKEQKELQTKLRVEKLSKYREVNPLEVENLSDDMFNTLLEAEKIKYEIEQKRLAEEAKAKRLAKEAQRIENEKLRAENAKKEAELAEARRLQAEAEAKEKKIKAEQEAKLRAEQEAQAKKNREELEKKEAEERARKNETFKKWLVDNNYNAQTDEYKQEGNKFVLYRKISEIEIK